MNDSPNPAFSYASAYPPPASAPECQLLVFWRWPRDGMDEILATVSEDFAIRRVARLHWTPGRIVENFQRFYAMPSGTAYQKYTQAGALPFMLVLVEDPAPVYRYRVAGGSGYKLVNARSFDLKQRLRSRGLALHGTNTPREFRRDVAFLLGAPAAAAQARHERWSGVVEDVHRDIVGAEGWRSLAEVFAVLNEAVDYVVLRNFEGLPDEHVLGPHGDVDLLVDDVDARNRAASILNAEQTAHTQIGGRKVYIDLRSVEDFYYDPAWCRRILRNKVLVNGFYAPSLEDYFFSLLYHGHIHKPKISRDYIDRLVCMAESLGLRDISSETLRDPDHAAKLICNFLRGHGYYLTRPHGCPAYNDGFAARLSEVPFLYQTASSFYQDVVKSAGQGGAGVADQVNRLNVQSRKWLLQALLRRLAAYPADLKRRYGS